MRRLFLLLLLGMLSARAATYISPSVNRVDLDAILTLPGLADGDIVVIPPGIGTDWTNQLTITKAIWLQGSGNSQTYIIDKVVGNDSLFSLATVTNKVTRVTGMEIQPDSPAQNGTHSIFQVTGPGQIALGGLRFTTGHSRQSIEVQLGSVTGVIYECQFNDILGIDLRHSSWLGGVFGDKSWETAVTWGGADFLFIEDCQFLAMDTEGALDGNGGARAVVRYCYIEDSKVLFHGNDSSNQQRSGRAMEVYNNTFAAPTISIPDAIVDRGGTFIVWGNTLTGGYNAEGIHITHYRRVGEWKLWNQADGVVAWDTPDLTDGAGTPGGAGDGVFESGTSTSGSALTLSDGTKAWGINAWAGYSLRLQTNYTASSGGSGTLTVSGAAWTTNQWKGWIVTRLSDNKRAQVSANTADTLTMIASPYNALTFSAGAVQFSRGAYITENTANTITIEGGQSTSSHMTPDGQNYAFTSGQNYEIRKVDYALDAAGRGISSPWAGTRGDVQNLGQNTPDPCYQWNNTKNGVPITNWNNSNSWIVEGRDFFNTAKPGYTPYIYPHPLRTTETPATFEGTTLKRRRIVRSF